MERETIFRSADSRLISELEQFCGFGLPRNRSRDDRSWSICDAESLRIHGLAVLSKVSATP